ncbi:DUF1294 domain-containing protein [Marinimicrobium agarilyticum]|uniref:DUF1294 domain-containing protein n=1 Tax=Marinimicrobium agarilyticum TaxID=306546 RepID=UPI0003F82BD5|nr:DUF1294 domain-containing protein [Marinimicrobium agarilyticum]
MKISQFLLAILAALAIASYYFGFTPIALSLLLIVFSLITYGLYAKDKAAAQKNEWRVSERTLHIAALLGGWPGALLAQSRLRHKTRKTRFRVVFWLTVLINFGGLAWLHTPQGNTQLRAGIYQVEDAAIAHIRQDTGLRVVLFLTKLRPDQYDLR